MAAALALLMLLGACSSDGDSTSAAPDDDRVEDADTADAPASDDVDTEDTDRPFGVDRDDLGTALAAGTGADDVEVDGATIRLIFEEGSVDSPSASINCSVANQLKADGDRAELVYPDGVLACDEEGGR